MRRDMAKVGRGMKLSSFLKRHKCPIAILMFDEDGKLDVREFEKDKLNTIPTELLNREVMESNYEEEVCEVWIR